MRREDYLRNELIEIKHCRCRRICPLDSICGFNSDGEQEGLIPTVLDMKKGSLAWTDLRNEQRVFVIKSGLMETVAVDDDGNEEPFSVYGPGYCIGLAELYIPREVCATYYLKSLTDSAVCSISAKAVRHRLESLPAGRSNSIICHSLTNWSAASFELLKLYSHPRMTDRLLLLIKYLRSQSGRLDEPPSTLSMTHDDLADLVRADRVSVSRALRRLEDERMLKLGYKSITVSECFDQKISERLHSDFSYHNPNRSE